jgi:uncharacterized protein with von Willebrand factor type A (vWA) domain
MPKEQHFEQDLVSRVVEFCRFARSRGLSAAVKESVDALEAIRITGVSDRENVKTVLRAVLCSSKDEWELFESIFEDFWRRDTRVSQLWPRSQPRSPEHRHPQTQQRTVMMFGQANVDNENDSGRAVVGATAAERLKKADFSEVRHSDLADLEQLSERLVRLMSLRISRKFKAISPSGVVDVRRTIRRGISRGGELLELRFKGKKRERSRLLLLLDISGSMNAYSIFLLKFVYALQRHFRQVNTFAFSTRLEDFSTALRSRRLRQVLASLAETAAGWSGGTKIGESLREFNLRHARRVLTRDTHVIILSDGWDTGDPRLLAAELAAIKRRSRKLIWLNPLLGLRDYQPLTRGMSAALPWIDIFAPAHNLESLLSLESHLARN